MAGIPGYPCYPTVEETLSSGNNLAVTYPNLAQWIDIGDSWEKVNNGAGYDLMVLKITNQQIVKNKPKLFIHSAMHAREYTPAALTLDFAKLLLQSYATDPDIQWIVDEHEVHILFHMNPDGRKIAETGVSQRKNTNSNHCAGGTVGVDLNRNFAFFWNTTANGSSGNDCSEVYRGSAPESEPETQAVSNYIRSLFPDVRGPNDTDAAPLNTPGMHIDIHSYSQLVLWPWGHTQTLPPNNQGLAALGNKLAWFNGYTPQQSVALYPTDGTSDDVSYGELGIAAFTFELGTSFFQQCFTYTNQIKPDNLKALVYAAKVVAAPYQLSLGPEITSASLNGAQGSISVTQGNNIDLFVNSSALQTRLSGLGKNVAATQFSIDIPIWQPNAQKVDMTSVDGSPTSGVEDFSAQIDTTNITAGNHKIYIQSLDSASNRGVVTVVSFDIAQNNSPVPSFVATCTNLSCSFDASASTDSDGNIVQFAWDFNGEAVANGQTPSYQFSQAGTKQVALTVTDNSGNNALTSQSLSVTAAPPPPAPTPSSSSGGGSMGLFSLLIFSLVGFRRYLRALV
ncbi:MAG: M14 family zinc carboxypeptidase [Enterobacterales bacterium]|nr:M14 family zinc carboxypeptidase [Enterobacterales bacterium]